MLLSAGPVSLTYVNGELRDITVGDAEVVRRVYVVFQDRNWTARPWIISNERVVAGKHMFEIAYEARGTFDARPFHFEALLSGDDEGTISFEFDGVTDSPFLRNRLGLCILHPMSAAGAACIVESTSGVETEAAFPTGISPDQPFADIRAITHEFAPGAWASVRMTGETFEMEDHRNWTDASFKTYCTPISMPFPVEVPPEVRLAQSLTLAIDTEDYSPTPAPVEPTIRLALDAAALPLPHVGLQLPADEPPWSVRTTGLLRDLALSHLRLGIHADDPTAPQIIADAAARAASIGARLVVALFVANAADLPAFASSVGDVEVDTWLVLDAVAKVSGPGLATEARAAFGPSARIGGGTDLYFTELNRERPDSTTLDVMTFSLNPQVHATDNQTIVQNLAAQDVVARAAGTIAGAAAVHVGPVTLRPRFNPNATAPGLDVSNTALPANVDARQMSQLGANWTLGSVKYLAEAGTVDAITYFETTGWRGIVERDAGSAQPADFSSAPGEAFPVHAALMCLRGFDTVRTCTSNLPELVDALLLEDSTGAQRLLLMSFADRAVSVRLDGFATATAQVTLEPFGLESIDLRKAGA